MRLLVRYNNGKEVRMISERTKKLADTIRKLEAKNPFSDARATLLGPKDWEVVKELNKESNDYLNNLAREGIEKQKRTS